MFVCDTSIQDAFNNNNCYAYSYLLFGISFLLKVDEKGGHSLFPDYFVYYLHVSLCRHIFNEHSDQEEFVMSVEEYRCNLT
jgi:hypothetical protein